MSDTPSTGTRTLPSRGTPSPDRTITRTRGLPGGRAVVGAFLVVAAAVGTFAAYLNASAAPNTAYLVAEQDIAVGERVTADMFRAVPIELPLALADTAIPAAAIQQLEGRQTLGPIATDDLVTRTLFQAPDGPEGTSTFSFAITSARALAGQVFPGDRVDLVATYTDGGASFTGYLAREVPILSTDVNETGLVLTIAVEDPALVLRIVNALETADLYVLRSDPDGEDTPPDFLGPEPRAEPEVLSPAAPPDAPDPTAPPSEEPTDGTDDGA